MPAKRPASDAFDHEEPEYAFTPRGWAIRIPAALNYRRIVARPHSSISWIEKVRSLKDEQNTVTRTELQLQENEKPKETEDDEERWVYLVIGITTLEVLGDLGEKIKEFPPGYKKRKAVGTYRKNGDILPVSDADLVIVVALEQDTNKAIQLYALVGPQEGICAAHRINQDQVFYFPQFRDNEGDVTKRKRSWNMLIQAQRISLPQEGASSDTDSALERLLDHSQESWSNEDSNDAVAQFEERFPTVKSLSAAEFSTIKQQIVAVKLRVPHRLLGSFVMEAAFQLEESREFGTDESTAAQKALSIAQRHADFNKLH